MAIVKVIEVLAESPTSWDDAAKEAVREASHTIKNIKSIYVKEMQAIVENDKGVSFRLNAKISFLVEE
jgi:flavin-binding protein dodecin